MNLLYQGVQTAIPEPASGMLFVSVWVVPSTYIEEGRFVSVHEAGELQQVPACAGSDAQLLAELTLSEGSYEITHIAEGASLE